MSRPTQPRLPFWRKSLNIGLASAIAVLPPAGCAYALAQGVAGGLTGLHAAIANTVLILCLVGMALHSLAKCSPIYLVIGMAGIGLAKYLLGLELTGAFLAVGLTGVVGLALGHVAYQKLCARTPTSKACAPAESLNSRCRTCHAKHFCPYQPGGMADKYSPK